jgi:hypothetical protein
LATTLNLQKLMNHCLKTKPSSMKPVDPKKKRGAAISLPQYNNIPAGALRYADSHEAMEAHYRNTLQQIEAQLATLSIMEHARQITTLCNKIISIKNKLDHLLSKQTYR